MMSAIMDFCKGRKDVYANNGLLCAGYKESAVLVRKTILVIT